MFKKLFNFLFRRKKAEPKEEKPVLTVQPEPVARVTSCNWLPNKLPSLISLAKSENKDFLIILGSEQYIVPHKDEDLLQKLNFYINLLLSRNNSMNFGKKFVLDKEDKYIVIRINVFSAN